MAFFRRLNSSCLLPLQSEKSTETQAAAGVWKKSPSFRSSCELSEGSTSCRLSSAARICFFSSGVMNILSIRL